MEMRRKKKPNMAYITRMQKTNRILEHVLEAISR